MTQKEFVSQYIKKHNESITRQFPDDFIIPSVTEKLELPQKTLILGNDFFGQHEILTTEGSSVLLAENIYKAKYIVYAGKDRKGSILIPKSNDEIKSGVESYEKHLDLILMDIKENFKKAFPESPNINSVSNEIFTKLNLVRY